MTFSDSTPTSSSFSINCRYPLAGDVAMKVETVRSLTMPADWGLEVGMLGDVFTTQPTRRICQVDIAGAYDHKHQELAVDDPDRGIHRMAIDITTSIVHALDANGSGLSDGNVRQLNDAYRNIARDMIDRYLHDAEMNRPDRPSQSTRNNSSICLHRR